jgi:hypothetical protein
MQPHPVRNVLAFVGLGIAALSAYFYEGPYRWFAELQMATWGSYDVKLTFLLAVLVCAGPLTIAHWAMTRSEIGGGASSSAASPQWEQLVTAFRVSPRAARVMLIGAVLIAVGGYIGGRALLAGSLGPVDVTRLEAGEDPPTHFAELHGGSLRFEASAGFREGVASSEYVPYVSSEDVPAAVFVNLSADAAPPAEGETLRGTLEWNALPGPVRAVYDERGEIAASHWVLRFRHDPRNDRDVPLGMAGFGLVMVLAGGLVVWRGRPSSY